MHVGLLTKLWICTKRGITLIQLAGSRDPQHYLFISSETTAETQGCNKHSWGTHPPKWSTTGRAACQRYKEATSGKREDSQRESKSLKKHPKNRR